MWLRLRRGHNWPAPARIDHNEQNDLKWGHCLPMWETLDLASASELTIESRVSRAASTAAVDREVRRFGVSALVGAVTAASFGVCEDN